MTVDIDGEITVLEDILVGDVWICGGQSNMEQILARTDGGLDYAEKYRNLPYVGVLKPEIYSK